MITATSICEIPPQLIPKDRTSRLTIASILIKMFNIKARLTQEICVSQKYKVTVVMTVMWMELWLLHPKSDLPEAASPRYKSLRPMINNMHSTTQLIRDVF